MDCPGRCPFIKHNASENGYVAQAGWLYRSGHGHDLGSFSRCQADAHGRVAVACSKVWSAEMASGDDPETLKAKTMDLLFDPARGVH